MSHLNAFLQLTSAVQSRLRAVFWGWWIVAGAVGLKFLLSLLLLQSYGTYAAVWREEFGWSATALALAFSLQRAETGLLGPFQGWLLQRFGARTIMRIGAVALGVGFILLSQIQTLITFFAVFLLMALGSSLMGPLSVTTVVVRWFDRKRATALALTQTGMSMGGLAVPVIAWTILGFGWRTVAVASGVIIALFGLLLSQLMRGHPEDYGLSPDGLDTRTALSGHGNASGTGRVAEYKTRQALKTRAFWFVSLGHALAVMVVSAVLVHLIVHLNEGLGYSIEASALLFAVMTGCTMIGQLGGGFIGDRFDKRKVAALAMLGHGSAILALAVSTSLPGVLYFVLVHGLSWGIRGPLMGAIRADYFGRKSFPTIMGFSSMIVMLGSISGPIIAGILADLLGNYRFGFMVLSGFALGGSAFFIFAKQPIPRAD